jgi:ketosteroid isomerase-like protein
MSQENVERTYRAFEAVNRRDLEAFVALMDPDLEFTTRFVEFEGDPPTAGYRPGRRSAWLVG